MGKNVNKRPFDRIPGIVAAVVLLILSAALSFFLYQSGILAPQTVLMLAGGFLALTVLCAILLYRVSNRGRFTFGLILGFIFLLGLVAALFFVTRTKKVITGISQNTKETSMVSVCVRRDDPVESLESMEGYRFGILRALDRENTLQALNQLASRTQVSPVTAEYDSLADLASGLLDFEVDAVILNHAYLGLFQEMEGYEDFALQIREVESLSVVSGLAGFPGAEDKAITADDALCEAGPVYTVYISGIDSPGDANAAARSDVNIIATINTDTHQVLLVSTPRDYYVPLSISDGAPDKLTHAGIYGIEVSMDTLGMLYDIQIPFYLRMNFAGFEQIIDALGGITVYSDYEFDSQNELGCHFVQGENQMDGKTALIFSRERFSFEDGDRQRGRNQMAVIQGVVEKMASMDMLRNFSAVMGSMNGALSTNVSYPQLLKLLQTYAVDTGTWRIVTYSVDGTGDTQVPWSLNEPAYVMVPDQATVDTAKALMASVRNGEILTS